MKKCILLLACSLSLCYGQTHDRMIYDIHKNESQLLESNIVHYTMCKNWNLTAEDIDIIIDNKKEEVYYEDVMIQYAYGYAPDYIFIEAKFKERDKNYIIKLGSTSWFIITDEDSKENKLYSCRQKDVSKLFIGDYVTEGLMDKQPELEYRYQAAYYKTIDNLLSQKVSSKWKGHFNLDIQNISSKDYASCNMKIDNDIHISVNGGEQTRLLFHEKNDTLFIYNNTDNQFYVYDSKRERKSSVGRGGYFFKIYKDGELFYVESRFFTKRLLNTIIIDASSD